MDPSGRPDSHPPTWQHIASSVLHVDLNRFEPLAALRCTIAVGIPLVIALALGQAGAGVFIAVGAVSVGFGSFQGAYRSRAVTMVAATIGMGISIFVGSVAGYSVVLTTIAAALWGFLAGLLVALGPPGGYAGLQSAVAVIVAGAYPSAIGVATGRAGLVLLGGAIQTLFVVLVWPLRRFRTERTIVSGMYRHLADYAREAFSGESMPPDPAAFVHAASMHDDPHPFAHAHQVLVFQALVDEAERLRTGLAALALSPARHRGDIIDHVVVLLTAIADAIDQGREPHASPREWEALSEAAVALRRNGTSIDALLGQLRGAWRTASVPSAEAGAGPRTIRRIRAIPPVRDAVTTLTANLTLRSNAFRHGLRLAVALAIATALYRLVEIPRGYWFAMTAVLVLKPEFRETFVTGGARILGTLAGAGLATLLVMALGTHHAVLTILLLAFVWTGYAIFRANYSLYTVCITGYVVLLLTLAGVTGQATAWYRVLDTILGGVLGLVIYGVWPTWESRHVPDVLATLLEALARDARLQFGMYVDPGRWDAQALRDSRAAARLARSNAEASIERMLSEPASSRRIDGQVALGLLAAARRYALGALAVHADLDRRPARAHPELAMLGDQIASSVESIAGALRTATPVPLLPRLRDAELAIEASNAEIAAEADMMVDSVNTMAALIARPSMLRRSA